ncbi:MAG TPA: ribosome biogenesis factor YjgA [Methylophilaceae bacterium]|nr:ribosome biogenesis factor YjgA [Methylophilaceae bacterium]
MKPNHSGNPEDTPSPEDVAEAGDLSKTKRKAAMEALQDLGGKLVDLSGDKLDKLDLPEKLRDAVLEARRITSNGAIRRQMQYIGRLMREVDTAPIEDQLQRWEGKHSAETAHFHQLERWRERLLKEESALSEFMQHYPHTDSQQMRTLIRNSQREHLANKPPKSSRELFKLLRDITENHPDTE